MIHAEFWMSTINYLFTEMKIFTGKSQSESNRSGKVEVWGSNVENERSRWLSCLLLLLSVLYL